MPRFVLALYVLDAFLVAAHVTNMLLGSPVDRLTRFIDLDGEANLPTWVTSIQWFVAAALLWRFAAPSVRPDQPISYLLWTLPAGALLFSLDEVALIHESVGNVLDRWFLDLPPGTHFANVLLGVPFAIGVTLVLFALRPHLRQSPGAFARLAGGMAMVLFGAIGFDALSFAVDGPGAYASTVVIEEGLELFGVTTVVWASHDLARSAATSHVADGVATVSDLV